MRAPTFKRSETTTTPRTACQASKKTARNLSLEPPHLLALELLFWAGIALADGMATSAVIGDGDAAREDQLRRRSYAANSEGGHAAAASTRRLA
jgi:hypothetical protein